VQLNELLEHFHITSWGVSRFQARCPAHTDLRASLSIRDADDRVLLKCHAGCTAEAITKACGLSLRDLFYDDTPGRGIYKEEAEASYIYTDEEGNFRAEKIRFPNKRFTWRTESGWGLNGLDPGLYRLPLLLRYNPLSPATVYIVEGEKDAEALISQYYVATCPPNGAGKWRAGYVKYFLGADVVVVADRDEAGYRHAEEIRESLETIARSVKVVQSKVGKDISDHLDAGYGVEELEPVSEVPA
jgi:putative DNA primase/helicase